MSALAASGVVDARRASSSGRPRGERLARPPRGAGGVRRTKQGVRRQRRCFERSARRSGKPGGLRRPPGVTSRCVVGEICGMKTSWWRARDRGHWPRRRAAEPSDVGQGRDVVVALVQRPVSTTPRGWTRSAPVCSAPAHGGRVRARARSRRRRAVRGSGHCPAAPRRARWPGRATSLIRSRGEAEARCRSAGPPTRPTGGSRCVRRCPRRPSPARRAENQAWDERTDHHGDVEPSEANRGRASCRGGDAGVAARGPAPARPSQ